MEYISHTIGMVYFGDGVLLKDHHRYRQSGNKKTVKQ
jgi:hypothetical protein